MKVTREVLVEARHLALMLEHYGQDRKAEILIAVLDERIALRAALELGALEYKEQAEALALGEDEKR